MVCVALMVISALLWHCIRFETIQGDNSKYPTSKLLYYIILWLVNTEILFAIITIHPCSKQ